MKLILIFFLISALWQDYEETGDFYFDRGDYFKAQLAYTKALSLVDEASSRNFLLKKKAVCLFKSGELEEARRISETLPYSLRKGLVVLPERKGRSVFSTEYELSAASGENLLIYSWSPVSFSRPSSGLFGLTFGGGRFEGGMFAEILARPKERIKPTLFPAFKLTFLKVFTLGFFEKNPFLSIGLSTRSIIDNQKNEAQWSIKYAAIMPSNPFRGGMRHKVGISVSSNSGGVEFIVHLTHPIRRSDRKLTIHPIRRSERDAEFFNPLERVRYKIEKNWCYSAYIVFCLKSDSSRVFLKLGEEPDNEEPEIGLYIANSF